VDASGALDGNMEQQRLQACRKHNKSSHIVLHNLPPNADHGKGTRSLI
jgi:hypothetical protein